MAGQQQLPQQQEGMMTTTMAALVILTMVVVGMMSRSGSRCQGRSLQQGCSAVQHPHQLQLPSQAGDTGWEVAEVTAAQHSTGRHGSSPLALLQGELDPHRP